MLRAVGVIRRSVGGPSESPQVQRQDIERKAEAIGARLVDIVVDLAVSAFKIPPMERPKLGAWLARPGDFDVLIYWRQDRFVRRVIPDFADMVTWATKHGIKLISATEDLGDPTQHAELVLPFLKAWLGEGESRSISARLSAYYAYVRHEGRWAGGKAPYGYMSVKAAEKQHALAVDEDAAAVVREAVRRVTAGETVNAIAIDLNRRGVPSPKNRERQLLGRPEVPDASWRRSSLILILRSPALLGYVVHGRQQVTGDDGMPIVRAPALISETDWDALQMALGTRAQNRERTGKAARRTTGTALLLRVAYCALCKAPLYRWDRSGTRPDAKNIYYRCAVGFGQGETRRRCPARSVRADFLEPLATDLFLEQVGGVELTRRVYKRADTADRAAQVHPCRQGGQVRIRCRRLRVPGRRGGIP